MNFRGWVAWSGASTGLAVCETTKSGRGVDWVLGRRGCPATTRVRAILGEPLRFVAYRPGFII